MMLLEALVARAGAGAVQTGWAATGFETSDDTATLYLKNRAGDGRCEQGAVLIGADGIHSAIRAQIAPDEGGPVWKGAVLWRGTTQSAPFKTGASMVMVGHKGLRLVIYPISKPDAQTGAQTINWIAHIDEPPKRERATGDWTSRVDVQDILPLLDHLEVDWLDIPALIKGADAVFEYPMVDRNPLDAWQQGCVSLMGDAAHAAYPVGSNGAGSAILDARNLGAAFVAHGVGAKALAVYEAEMRPRTSAVTLMNRSAGPDSILDVVEARSAGRFDDINDVIPHAEMAAHADKYKATAGFGVAQTNASAPLIAPGTRVG
jgi:2-polyprenyl-6-methoxyphenol hydroxylase-like FAD-dependent oxidoreductase